MPSRIPDPPTLEAYNEVFNANTRVEGYFTDVCQHVPCPFCAQPDWQQLRPAAGVLPGDDRPNIDAQMAEVRKCSNCGRSAKAIVTRTENGVSAEFVQTGGDPPPSYLPPMRRVDG